MRASPRELSLKFLGTATTVYLLEEREGGPCWVARATSGEGVQPDPVVAATVATLGMIFREQQALLLEGRTLVQEDYAHLNVRRTIKALACLPLIHGEVLVGCVELLSFDEEWDQSRIEALQPFAEISASALAASQDYEEERNGTELHHPPHPVLRHREGL